MSGNWWPVAGRSHLSKEGILKERGVDFCSYATEVMSARRYLLHLSETLVRGPGPTDLRPSSAERDASGRSQRTVRGTDAPPRCFVPRWQNVTQNRKWCSLLPSPEHQVAWLRKSAGKEAPVLRRLGRVGRQTYGRMLAAERPGPEAGWRQRQARGPSQRAWERSRGRTDVTGEGLRSGGGAEASEIRVSTVNLTSSVPTGWQGLETFMLQIDPGPPLLITLRDNPQFT